jgi:membrane-associated PAP2 superfamily phosphatase
VRLWYKPVVRSFFVHQRFLEATAAAVAAYMMITYQLLSLLGVGVVVRKYSEHRKIQF